MIAAPHQVLVGAAFVLTHIWWLAAAFAVLAVLIWRLAAVVLSALDWFLVRVVAVLAGAVIARWSGPALGVWLRYGLMALWIVGGGFLATRLPTPLGLWPACVGMLTVLGVARRWSWVERDRESFLVERSPARARVGFEEDLRDEALTAIVGLLILMPIALEQADHAFHAFELVDPHTGHHLARESSLWDWLGFFGAELAKAAPFVDWSEVFFVDNGSPIEPRTGSAVGAALVFAVRCSMDLLLLAAVLQAVQIAGRVRDQNQAFTDGRLPILDPFAELERFGPFGRRSLDVPITAKLTDHVADFPGYDEKRLTEISAGVERELANRNNGGGVAPPRASPVERDAAARNAAMAVLARQYPEAPGTARLLSGVAAQAGLEEGRRLRALELLADANSDAAERPLIAAASDAAAAPALRLLATRELGRLRRAAALAVLRVILADGNTPLVLRAHAGVALAKLGGESPAIEAAARQLSGAHVAEAVLPLAYALALAERSVRDQRGQAAGIAARFPGAREVALRAALAGLGAWDKTKRLDGGTFNMGSPPEEEGYSWERPQHQVSVPAVEIGIYAVTFEEYDAFCDATGREKPDDRRWGREQRPVINVSWDDANAYCAWLGSWTGERWRLPSEAEWEYACRAGTTTPFSFGATISTDQANYDGNYTYGAGQKGVYRGGTTPVGSFPPNDFGLYDMHGNVWEWCADAWHGSYAAPGRPDDGRAWLTDGPSLRVLRGGSWNSDPSRLRSAVRFGYYPVFRNDDVGFRVARTVLAR
jgi:formylglycine-generating enzyme required for sulfatase activity